MPNNYNSIAKVYDALSRLVFGNAIVKAQQYLVQFISNDCKVLIVGGGTGWILEEISKLQKKNISVVYVEKSSAMIGLAKKKNYKNINVHFEEQAIEQFIITEDFDVIITPFLFDNFLENKIRFVFKNLDQLLKQKGIWLYADFVTNKKIWQQLILKTMYLFFKLTANIETQELIDMRKYFADDYELSDKQFFCKGFIQANVYKKIID